VTTTFRTRIPALSDAELRRYVERPLDYRTEAVEAAARELSQRGQSLSDEAWQRLRDDLQRRDAETLPNPGRGSLLGMSPATRTKRIRLVIGTILVAGLGTAIGIYVSAGPPAANPLGYEPLHTKTYLRGLELYGGKVNVLATEFMRWWAGLWHGRTLAYTVTTLTIGLALAFWFAATRLSAPLHPTSAEDEGSDS
jgi:hypothetical protein